MIDEPLVEDVPTEEATATDVEMQDYEVEGSDDSVDLPEEATASTEEGESDESHTVEEGTQEESDVEETVEGVEGDIPAQKHKTGDQRFHDLTEQKYEAVAKVKVAEDRLAATLAELERLKATPVTTEAPPAKLTRPSMPTRDSVDYDDEKYAAAIDTYQDNLEAYHVQQSDERHTARETTRLQNVAINHKGEVAQAVDDAYAERQVSFEASHSDYSDVVHSDSFKLPTVAFQALKEAENGPELLYSIAKSPKLASKLLGMRSASQVLMELGRLSNKLNSGKNTKKVSNAPEPIDPVNSSGATNLQVDDENMPMGDFMKKMEKTWYGNVI